MSKYYSFNVVSTRSGAKITVKAKDISDAKEIAADIMEENYKDMEIR